MIDIHCHIIPGIDDGPETLDQSLAMASMAVRDGINTIMATPHTLNGVYKNPVEKVSSRLIDLEKALAEKEIPVILRQGADVHLCPGMVQRIKSKDAGTIDNAGKFLLLELPDTLIPEYVKDEIFALKLNGITPIITHVERNAGLLRDLTVLYTLIRMGALSQVTAMSITGDFGEAVKQAVEKLLKLRLVHIIASDAHSPDHRPPILSHAVEQAAQILGSLDEAERMVKERPAAILAGLEPDVPEPKRENTGGFRRFFGL